MEGRTGDAISLLERYLKDWADDSLHVKLAQVFAATNLLQDALSHYQSALRLNLIQDVFQLCLAQHMQFTPEFSFLAQILSNMLPCLEQKVKSRRLKKIVCFSCLVLLSHSRINAQNEAAKKGLERLEKQMKVCCLLAYFVRHNFL